MSIRDRVLYAVREGRTQELIVFAEQTGNGLALQGYSRTAGWGDRWDLVVHRGGTQGTTVVVRRSMSWWGRFWVVSVLCLGVGGGCASLLAIPLRELQGVLVFGLAALFNCLAVAIKARALRDPVGKFVAERLDLTALP